MQKKIILLLILFLSCSKENIATGNSNTITIIASREDKLYSEHIIQHFFQNSNKTINTPQIEYIYDIKWADLNNLNQSTKMKNILLVSLDYPKDSTIDVLSNKILTKNNISSKFAIFSDLFAQNQKVAVLKATDAVELEKLLESYNGWLYSEYEDNMYDDYYSYLHINGNNDDLEESILNRFKLSIFIQKDYEILYDSGDLLWVGRGYPYRWLIFYKVPKSMIKHSPYNIFENMINDYDLKSIDISDKNYYKKMNIGNDLEVFRGIYSNDETGGPFALYMLDNVRDDEVILVASIINNPGKSKVPHLLQVDALIRNAKF